MSRSIVCGVDGSDESLRAASVASCLARQLGAGLLVAHAPERAGDVDGLFDRIAAELGSPVDGRVLRGHAAKALAKLAHDEDAMVVVVGSRGRGVIRAALAGSTSLNLSSAVKRPLVIVPPAAAGAAGDERLRARSIVCGVDGSPPAIAATLVAADLARALSLELVLLHIYESLPASVAIAAPVVVPVADYRRLREKQRRAAEAVLDAVAHGVGARQSTRTVVQPGDPVSGLVTAADDHDAALIVVGTHGRGALAAALLGSTSARVAAGASAPVLMVPEGSQHDFKDQISSL